MRNKLNPKIIKRLKERTGLKENVIRVRISEIRKDCPFLTLNAAAYIFGKKKGVSVARMLDKDDRESLKTLKEIEIEGKTTEGRKITKIEKKIIEIAKFETNDKFLSAHINEINRAYTYGCYTACFVLMRKVLENLIVKILKEKYPEKKEEHIIKYFDTNRRRNHDFNVLLKNLEKSSKDFYTEENIVKRICELANPFRETANEMTHSIYHIATKKEIDESKFQYTLDLIKELFQKHLKNSR
jgi:hypothetical protein